MQTLGLTPTLTTPPANLSPQPDPRSTTIAFVLSALLPGLGQFYCGKKTRAIWTLIFFLASAVLTIALLQTLGGAGDSELFWGMAFRAAVFLYAFAVLDAFYTAREMTQGTDAFISENPRVAAILNLLTRGFGYWYLGERKKGLAVFVILGIAQQSLRVSSPETQIWISLLLEVALAVLALDAYRIAKQRLRSELVKIPPQSFAATPATVAAANGFPAGVAVAWAMLPVFLYAVLVIAGLSTPDYSRIDQSQAAITPGENENSFANPTYGVSMRAPSDWILDRTAPGHFVTATAYEGGCKVQFLPDVAPLIGGSEAVLDTILESNPGMRLVGRRETKLGPLNASEFVLAVDVQGTTVYQEYVVAPRGRTLYALIITTADVLRDACKPGADAIRNSVAITK